MMRHANVQVHYLSEKNRKIEVIVSKFRETTGMQGTVPCIHPYYKEAHLGTGKGSNGLG